MLGKAIELTGYGRLRHLRERAEVVRFDSAMRVILCFADESGEYEVPFRLNDGYQVGSTPEGGYCIPQGTLRRLKELAGSVSNEEAKPDESSARLPVRHKPAGREQSMSVTAEALPATVEPKPKPKARNKPKPETQAQEPAAQNGKNEAAKAPTTRTRTAKPAAQEPKPKPKAKSVAEARANVKPRAEATEKVKKAPPAVKPDSNLSPMEIAAQEERKAADGEISVRLSPLMFRQLVWDEIRPVAADAAVKPRPGFAQFRRAMDSAIERNYVYLHVNATAARFLLGAFKRGFEETWKGPLAGGFKRAAKRVAEEIAAKFGPELLPPVIAEYESKTRKPTGRRPGRPRKNPEPAPAPTAARKPTATGKPKPKLKARVKR